MEMKWGDKRYHTLNYFLREKFGEKVFKISLDAGFSCPNRDGTISSGGCVFCSERGSGDFAGDRKFSITSQFEEVKSIMKKKWKGDKYIAYFQPYTNTYAPIEILKDKYEEALMQKGVVGLAIATRPDCLDEEVLNLLSEINKKTYLWVELGLQTVNDDIGKIINRGYGLSTFEKALKELRNRNIDVVVHTIFGLPSETKQDMINTIKYLSHKDVQGLKIHLLHLMEGTPLVNIYEKGQLKFLTQEEYIDIVCESIGIIREDIVIHRLTGDSPRDLLIGPKWSLKKWEILNSIDRELESRGIYQGINYKK